MTIQTKNFGPWTEEECQKYLGKQKPSLLERPEEELYKTHEPLYNPYASPTQPGKSMLSTKLTVICAYCGKKMGEKEGHGVTGETSSICRECWEKLFPDEPYPEEEPQAST